VVVCTTDLIHESLRGGQPWLPAPATRHRSKGSIVSLPFAIGPMAIFAIAIIAIGVVVLTMVVRPLRRLAMTDGAQRSAKAAELRVRARSGIAILAATVVAIVGVAATSGSGVTGAGRALAVMPLLAVGAAILVFVVAPTPEFLEPRARRSAELSRRHPRNFVPTRTLLMPVIAAIVLTAALVVFWRVAEADGQTISHSFGVTLPDDGMVSSTSGPFPGYYYGIPVLIALGLLCGLAALAFARIAAAPRPTDESLRAADDATRTLSIRAVSAAVTSAVVFTLGAVLLVAGSATRNVGSQFTFRINAVPVESGSDMTLMALSTIEFVVGGVSLLVAVVLIAMAIGHAMRRPFAVTAAEQQPA
jgi:hypothetical protein